MLLLSFVVFHSVDWLKPATRTDEYPGGVADIQGCESYDATLTADGQALFPDLSNSDINHQAGPCHNHFDNFTQAGFRTLATDYYGRSYIIINRGTIEGVWQNRH